VAVPSRMVQKPSTTSAAPLMPAADQDREAGRAVEFERTHLTARRHVSASAVVTVTASRTTAGRSRTPSGRSDLIFEQARRGVLAPVKVEVAGKPRTQHMGAGAWFERQQTIGHGQAETPARRRLGGASSSKAPFS